MYTEIGGGERWEIGVIVSGIVPRNEPRVLELCRVFSSRRGRGGKVLSNTPPRWEPLAHKLAYAHARSVVVVSKLHEISWKPF